jgi:uncharacterized protein YjbJ (UPF0337 family)
MDHDRIEGGTKTLAGRVKESFGRMLGDGKLRADGMRDQVEGRLQNTIGGIKDHLREDRRGL